MPIIYYPFFIFRDPKFYCNMESDVVDLEDIEDPEALANKNVRYIISANQLHSLSLAELNLPPGLCFGYWKLNTFNQRLTTPSDVVLSYYCPLFIGPFCTPLRRKSCLKLFATLTFWLSAAQIIMYMGLLSVSHNPLHNTAIDPKYLVKYGCLSGEMIRKHNEYWRCISLIIMHSSFGHLCINVFLQMAFVLGREAQWNPLRAYGSFILSTISGSFFALLFNPNAVSSGSSNGIFGVFGSFITLYFILFENLQWRHRIGALFFICLVVILLIFAGVQNGTDSAGHIGAFLFGIFFGALIFINRIRKRNQKVIALIFGIMFTLVTLLLPIIFWLLEIDISKILEFFKKIIKRLDNTK